MCSQSRLHQCLARRYFPRAKRQPLHTLLMEILQMLTYMFREERLNFMAGLVDLEHDLTVIEEDYDEVRGLLLDGRIDEFMQRMDQSFNTD